MINIIIVCFITTVIISNYYLIIKYNFDFNEWFIFWLEVVWSNVKNIGRRICSNATQAVTFGEFNGYK